MKWTCIWFGALYFIHRISSFLYRTYHFNILRSFLVHNSLYDSYPGKRFTISSNFLFLFLIKMLTFRAEIQWVFSPFWNILWKWNNLVSVSTNNFIFRRNLGKTRYTISKVIPPNFLYMNPLSRNPISPPENSLSACQHSKQGRRSSLIWVSSVCLAILGRQLYSVRNVRTFTIDIYILNSFHNDFVH